MRSFIEELLSMDTMTERKLYKHLSKSAWHFNEDLGYCGWGKDLRKDKNGTRPKQINEALFINDKQEAQIISAKALYTLASKYFIKNLTKKTIALALVVVATDKSNDPYSRDSQLRMEALLDLVHIYTETQFRNNKDSVFIIKFVYDELRKMPLPYMPAARMNLANALDSCLIHLNTSRPSNKTLANQTFTMKHRFSLLPRPRRDKDTLNANLNQPRALASNKK